MYFYPYIIMKQVSLFVKIIVLYYIILYLSVLFTWVPW